MFHMTANYGFHLREVPKSLVESDIVMSAVLPWFRLKRPPLEREWAAEEEVGWKTFQNLKVSSAAALATVVPSGLKAKCNTLDE